MANAQARQSYKSFEQFKAELFPKLTENDRMKVEGWDSKQLGKSLADKAVDQMLHTNQNHK